MQKTQVKPDMRRRAGLILGCLGWVPDDLDTFLEILPGTLLYGEKNEEKTIEHRFWMAKYPVTNLQFSRFIQDGGYDNPDWWSKDGWEWRTGKPKTETGKNYEKIWQARRPIERRNQPFYWDNTYWNNPISPVVGVTWFEAEAYCNWLTTRITDFEIPQGYFVRLPTDIEWERVARFTDGREYPWGAEFDQKLSNTRESGDIGTTAVCTYPLGQSRDGVWDLGGNIWEWSGSWYEKGVSRSLRGGSWSYDSWYTRCSVRLRLREGDFNGNLGFRCVVSLRISEE